MQIYQKEKEMQNTVLNAAKRKHWKGTDSIKTVKKIIVSGAERISPNSQDIGNYVRNARLHKKEFVKYAVRIFLTVCLTQNIVLIADKNKPGNRKTQRFSAISSAKHVNTGAMTRISAVTIFQLQGRDGTVRSRQTAQSTKKENES